MKERKYKEEYKLKTQLDEKTGKPRQVPVYMGDYYELPKDMDRRSMVMACTVWPAAFALCYIAYLLLDSPSSRCIYVLPFACCATIPMLYAIIGAVNALRFPRRMTRVQRETGIARVMRSMIGCIVLMALAASGDVIFMIRSAQFAGELPAALLLLGALAAALTAFRRVKRIYNALVTIPGRASKEAEQA